MRTLAFAALLLGAVCLVSAANTPPDHTQSADVKCLLDGLSFSNGLSLVPAFNPTVFHYQCSCAWNENAFSTIAYPSPLDPGSHVNVDLNGVGINDFDSGTGISIGGQVPGAPNKQSGSLRLASGLNTIVIGVACGTGQCYYEYTISCYKPPDGFVVGDPQFVGLRGQNYQVHGVSGEVYNIVSDSDIQYNSKFVFLNSGDCPVVNGKKQKGCFSHPGSYLGELGLKTRAGDKVHLVTGSAKEGFKEVSVNGKPLQVGETVLLADDMGFVSLNTTHLASVQIGVWDFGFENSDMFVNQRVRVLDARGLHSHGLLGQTWRDTLYPNPIKFVQGAVDDYVIRDRDLFGDNFLYNAFN